jgi:methionyl-tRNA formyltransferase
MQFEFLESLKKGTLTRIKQEKRPYVRGDNRLSEIRFGSQPSREILRIIRAFGRAQSKGHESNTWCFENAEVVTIRRAKKEKPGRVLSLRGNRIYIAAKDGAIRINDGAVVKGNEKVSLQDAINKISTTPSSESSHGVVMPSHGSTPPLSATRRLRYVVNAEPERSGW